MAKTRVYNKVILLYLTSLVLSFAFLSFHTRSFKPGMSRRDVVGEVAPTHAKKSFASRLKAEVCDALIISFDLTRHLLYTCVSIDTNHILAS